MLDYPSYFWGGSGEVLHIVKDWDGNGKALCGRVEGYWRDAGAREEWDGKRPCKACSEEPKTRGYRVGRNRLLQEAMLALWGRGC